MKLSQLLILLVIGFAFGEVFFLEKFDDESWEKRWVTSEWKKGSMGKWKLTAGDWYVDKAVNQGMQTQDDMRFHAISSKIEKPFSNEGKDLVVQFSVKHEKKEYAFCGGGYIKLLPGGLDQKSFGGDSEYQIMFGPDLCGYDVSRIHAIFTYKGKNLLKKDEIKLDYAEKDEYTHLYTLVVHPDNTYEIYFDLKEKSKGSLPEGWDFPSKTIDDPSDKKPSDWVDEKEIPDPDDKKPSDWDDIPEMIADPDATKPDEWDDDLDGEWEAPKIKNPAFKGEWKQKMISNPKYKGEWKPKQLANPDYDSTVYMFKDISYVGFELWTVNNGTIFDNIIVTDSFATAKDLAEKTFTPFSGQKEKDAKDAYTKKKDAEKKASEPAKEEEEDDEDEEDEKKDSGKDEL